MNKDGIIRMARDAGAGMLLHGEACLMGDLAIERFAYLVAAAEREKVKAELNELKATQCTSPWQDSPACRGIARAIEAEREACAKVCDEQSDRDGFEGGYANECAELIRARGEK